MTRTRKTLTAAAVERIKPPKKGRAEYFDAALPGFALRVTERGFKSWVVFYRVAGKLRRHTIGSYPAFSLKQAREAARAAQRGASEGGDPAAEKIRRRREPAPEPDTFAATVQDFIREHVAKKKPRTQQEYKRPLEGILTERWGKWPVGEITRRDIKRLIAEIADKSGPVAANRTLAIVKIFFNWSTDEEVIDASPAVRIKPVVDERSLARDRVLSDDELIRVWAASEAIGYPFGHLAKLLLVTAQRRAEISGMRWDEIDRDSNTWSLPRARTKAGRPHLVPLSSLALDILDNVPRADDAQYVFTTTGDKPVSGFSRAKARLDTLAQIEDWRLHDLRRTAATGLRRLHISRDVVAAILGHASRTVMEGHYDMYDLAPEKLAALEAWGGHITAAVEGRAAENVVSFREATS